MKKTGLSTIACAVILSGCAATDGNSVMGNISTTAGKIGSSVGNVVSGVFKPYENGIYVSPEQLSQIKPGKSSSKDVIAIIGHPASKEQLKNKEIWSYPYSKITHFGANTNETTLIELNASGVVLNAYKSGGRKDSSGNPLLDAANGV